MSVLTKTTYLTLAVLFFSRLKDSSNLDTVKKRGNLEDSRVYWNVPTYECHKYGIHFEEVSRYFNIKQNLDDKFSGKEITVLYEPGMFPAVIIDENDEISLQNGGVPQKGNLEKHLKKFEKQVNTSIPDPTYEGLAIISFESWHPIFRHDNKESADVYRALSILNVEEQYPKLNTISQMKKAVKKYERWGRIFVEKTLKYAQDMRPKAKWGYRNFPSCLDNFSKQYSGQCDTDVAAQNDEMSWLFAIEDVILPVVQLRHTLNNTERIGLVKSQVTEAMRMARKSNPKPKVFVHLSYKYEEVDMFLMIEDVANGVRAINDLGADGYIIEGSPNDVNSEGKCRHLRNYLNTVLGPAIFDTEQLLQIQKSVQLTML